MSTHKFFNRRWVIVISVSFLFGIIMSIIKGNGADLRGAIGNICAPWLLLPFLSCVYVKSHRTIQSAMIGFLVSICSLSGFYFANSFVLDLAPNPWVVNLVKTMRTGEFYYKLSFLSGPFFGALGGWYFCNKALTPALLMALLFILEPLTWIFYDWGGFSTHPIVAVVEATIGVIACIVLVIRFKFRHKNEISVK